MLTFINKKLSRQVVVGLLIVLLPILFAATVVVVDNATTRMENETILSGEIAARAGASAYEEILTIGINNGTFSMDDLIHPVYTNINGIITYPNDPRTTTNYDHYTDLYVQFIEDAILHSSPDFLYTTGMAVSGYVPTTHADYSKIAVGVEEWDKIYARSKKTYTTPLHKAAAKVLVPVAVLPYVRDTGESCWDVIAPIFVNGYHWGAFRVGVMRKSINDHKAVITRNLIGIFLLLAIGVTSCMFLIIRSNMRALENIAEMVESISMGENLYAEIRSKKKNEIGRVAKAFHRMRNSLVAAMSRIPK